MLCRSTKIIDPVDGAILNKNDGKQDLDGLEIIVRGVAPYKSKVTINDVKAETIREGCASYDIFACKIRIGERENHITAKSMVGNDVTIDSITVLWDRNSIKRYRFSTDDNILFLKDLTLNTPQYGSIFDNDYLAFWKGMHDKYGTKVHFNIYYQTGGFNLSQMPDKYKSEWEENSGWIRLTFHALQDEPPNPYVNASYQEMLHDFELVTGEIIRFAGRSLLSPFTTVHWADASLDACKALRNSGIMGLVGGFYIDPDVGKPFTSYYVGDERTKYLNGRDYWKDTKTDIIFIKHDLVINKIELDDITPTLDFIASNPQRSDVMEVIIHEHYFRPELSLYEPDVKERVSTTLEWLTRNGYKSVFYEEGFLGSPE